MFKFLQPKNPESKILNKKIPTLVGLFVLVGALIAGTLLIGEGGGVFAPRATPQTTPKKIEVTNVTDRGFTVSFLTDESTVGFVKYGSEPESLKSQASDDRVQLEGKITTHQAHHITVSGLQPNTTYYYALGTGSNAEFLDNDKPFSVTTTARNGAPAAARTIYGSVSNEVGNPAEGAIVYITLPNAGKMSSLVKSSGSWAVPLSNARTLDGSAYAQVADTDTITITVQGFSPTEVLSQTTTVAEAQPVPTIALGSLTMNKIVDRNESTEDANAEVGILEVPTDDFTPATSSGSKEKSATPSASPDTKPTATPLILPPTASPSASPTTSPTASPSASPTSQPRKRTTDSTILDLDDPIEVVETTQPKIIGTAPPGISVKIEVHSETEIFETVTTNQLGEFELSIAELSKSLEPGEHTVTYSYTDPTTGEEVEKTVVFTVAGTVENKSATTTTGGNGGTTNGSTTSGSTGKNTMSSGTSGSSSTTGTTGGSTSTGSNTKSSTTGTNPGTTTATTGPYGTGNPFPPTAAPASSAAATPATESGRGAMPATNAAIPVSGSIGTTLALIMGGMFFITSGAWSFWISKELNKENA